MACENVWVEANLCCSRELHSAIESRIIEVPDAGDLLPADIWVEGGESGCGQWAGSAGAHYIANAMHVDRREGESVEQLIRRFNKGVVAERITKTYREKMYFVSKGEQRKEKRRRAERNRRKRERMTPRF